LSLNLDFHVNNSLSQAHAIELIRGPADDGNGNDLRVFQDDHGHAVSGTNTSLANYIRFAINGVLYYAPCLYTDPGAQAATTGKVVLTPPVIDRPTNAALLTDFITFQTQAALRTNDALLTHVGAGHQAAHVAMTATPLETLAPDGHAYSNYLVRFQFNNKLYSIPCHTRLGGPSQLMRGINLLANVSKKDNSWFVAHDDVQRASFYLTDPTAGTRPFTITYQVGTTVPTWNKSAKTVELVSDTWADMDDYTPDFAAVLPTAKQAFYDISLPGVVQIKCSEGGGSEPDDMQAEFIMRAKIENISGTLYTNYAAFFATDTDGSWIFSGPDSEAKSKYYTIIGSPAIQ
jgi:hypothetical protein